MGNIVEFKPRRLPVEGSVLVKARDLSFKSRMDKLRAIGRHDSAARAEAHGEIRAIHRWPPKHLKYLPDIVDDRPRR